MQPLGDRHKIAQVVQIQFFIPPDLSRRTFYLKRKDFGRQPVISIARAMPLRSRLTACAITLRLSRQRRALSEIPGILPLEILRQQLKFVQTGRTPFEC